MVDWGRLVGFVFGFSSVLNISNVSAISVINTVSHSLDSSIRKSNSVASRGSIPITRFSLTKVDSRVVILSSIFIAVGRGNIRVDRGRGRGMVGTRSRWGSYSSSDKDSKSNNGLKM